MSAKPDVPGSPALPRGFLREGGTPKGRLYLRPLETLTSAKDRVEVLVRGAEGTFAATVTVAEARTWAGTEGEDVAAYLDDVLEYLQAPVPAFAGLPLDRPLIMGIINVTPDSFSDGGEVLDPAAAVARGRGMIDAGAHILDVGGESTRPGAAPVTTDEELARVVPVVRALCEAGATVSIDTRHADVMAAALGEGAAIVNDVTALTGDARSLDVVAEHEASVILMHMQGEPGTMQDGPDYEDAALDVYDYLADRVRAVEAAGVARSKIAVDPGIGFGKTRQHNVEILGRLSLYQGLGCAVTLGASRKSFIAGLDRDLPPKQRVAGSLAAALAGVQQGVHILRVHDVAETRQAMAVWRAVEM